MHTYFIQFLYMATYGAFPFKMGVFFKYFHKHLLYRIKHYSHLHDSLMATLSENT
jgi:hypothetical protein